MDPVHLNKLFSISNWWFLIPCYCQNSIGDLWNTLCSNTLKIYAFTNNITINQHIYIYIHQPYHNHSTYMYLPTISQSINIYVFTNHITINEHICIHQQYHNQSTYVYSPTSTLSYNSTTSYYFSQFKWGENTPHYDKHHIPHLAIIHVSSYNQIKLSTKDLPSIWF